jgi:hypothetical protein
MADVSSSYAGVRDRGLTHFSRNFYQEFSSAGIQSIFVAIEFTACKAISIESVQDGKQKTIFL